MGILSLELEEPVQGDPCPCCGGRTTRLTRFVYSNGDAYAVYYAAFSDNHPDRRVSAVVSLGEWGAGSTPDDRVAFAVRIWPGDTAYNVTVLDADQCLWRDAGIIGRVLNRSEALAHPWLDEVFHITDHMVLEDPPVREYLAGGRQA